MRAALLRHEGRSSTEQTAKEVEAENFGLRALQIDDCLRLEALDAKEKLAPYGVSLTAVVAEFIRWRGSATVTVDQVAEKFLASRSKLQRSEKHWILSGGCLTASANRFRVNGSRT